MSGLSDTLASITADPSDATHVIVRPHTTVVSSSAGFGLPDILGGSGSTSTDSKTTSAQTTTSTAPASSGGGTFGNSTLGQDINSGNQKSQSDLGVPIGMASHWANYRQLTRLQGSRQLYSSCLGSCWLTFGTDIDETDMRGSSSTRRLFRGRASFRELGMLGSIRGTLGKDGVVYRLMSTNGFRTEEGHLL